METKLVDAEKLKKAYSVMEGFQKTGEKDAAIGMRICLKILELEEESKTCTEQ